MNGEARRLHHLVETLGPEGAKVKAKEIRLMYHTLMTQHRRKARERHFASFRDNKKGFQRSCQILKHFINTGNIDET